MKKANIIEQLEDRILFDAVPDGLQFIDAAQYEPVIVHNIPAEQQCCGEQSDNQELIVVDSSVENSAELLESVLNSRPDGNFEVLVLSTTSDGVNQITNKLESRSNWSAIHILSHGSSGSLQLGSGFLDSGNLSQYTSEIASWQSHLGKDADLLLYGCDVASDANGMTFVQQLSELSGADVAASVDTTGPSDWDLELHSGAINVSVLDGSSWDGTLNTPPAFNGDAGLFQVYSKLGQLAEMDIAGRQLIDADNNAGEKLNAVGYRNADDYAYGILTKTSELGRLGADGTVQNLGSVDGLPQDAGNFFVGDFGGDDLLYVRGGKDTSTFYGINVDTMTVDRTLNLSSNVGSIYDIAYNADDNHFYTSQRNNVDNQLIKINAETGDVTKVGGNGIFKHTFGAMFADSTGKVFGASNKTGEIFSFNIETGEATKVGLAASSGTNDGFSNAFEELELPPLAADDEYSIVASDTISSSVFDDNGNGADIDGDGDSISVVAVQGQSQNVGTQIQLDSGALVTLNNDGTFSYDTNGAYADLVIGQTEVDSFTYTITDGALESQATVYITIEGEFDPTNSGKEAGVEICYNPEDVVNLKGLNDEAKTLVMSSGDFNGDGYEDVVVGDSSTRKGAGSAYVVYGSADGLPEDFNVKDLLSKNGGDGSKGMVIQGATEDDRLGFSVSSAGDLNNDGFDDIVIGATDVDTSSSQNAGAAFVIYGNSDGATELNVSDLYTANGGDGSAGFVLNGDAANDLAGSNVSSIGDLNGDGYADIAIAAKDADVGTFKNAGKTYVYFGGAENEAVFELSDLEEANGGDGSEGFVIHGVGAHDHLGHMISGGVDVNGDGLDDMVVTAQDANSFGMNDTGQSYVIFGSQSDFDPTFDLNSLFESNGGDGTSGFVIHGTDKATGNGSYVSIVEDMNGDGIGEIAMGVSSPNAEDCYVLYGKDTYTPEFQIISMKDAGVYVDNFDTGTNHDLRSWDGYMNSVTVHSTEGTRVTIWGDPHVITEVDGVESKFDIGYGTGLISLSTGTQITWTTYDHDPDDWPLGPPLSDFSVLFADSSNNLSFDTADGVNTVDELSALSDAELREFAAEIAKYAGSASEPLTYVG